MKAKRLIPISVYLLSVPLWAAQFLIVSKSPEGSFQFAEAENISIGGGDKVRVLGAESSGPLDPKVVSHLPEEHPSAFRILRKSPEGMIARSEPEGPWRTLLPQNKASQPTTGLKLWNDAAISAKKNKDQKVPDTVQFATLYAIIPGESPSDSAAELATHVSWLASPDDSLPMIAAIVKSYPGSPAVEKLRKGTEELMLSDQKIWLDGGAARTVLGHWLDTARLAETAFSSDSRLKELAAAAHRQETALTRQTAILNAFDAGGQADAFLLRYGAFEPWQHFSDPLAEARARNYRLSARLHFEAGNELKARKNYAAALAEFRVAAHRDAAMQTAANAVEETRLELAKISSAAAAERRKGLDVRSPQQVQLQRHVLMADQYLKDKKPAESQKELDAAQAIDADAAVLVLTQAKLFAAQGQLGKALATMDRYAGVVTNDPEFLEGEKYRASLSFDLERQKAALKTKLAGEFSSGKFSTALQTAASGLTLDTEDADFQFQAGINACILRHCDRGAQLLQRYLESTDTLNGDPRKRILAFRLLQPRPAAPAAADARLAHAWLSGARLTPETVYDPVSLAFQPKAAEIKASRKLSIGYQWAGGNLQAVHSKYEDNHTGMNLMSAIAGGLAAASNVDTTVAMQGADTETNDFYFEYATDFPQVARVTREQSSSHGGLTQMSISVPAAGTAGVVTTQSYSTQPDERRDSSQGYLTLWNSPNVDTALALQLSGKRVAVGFSGNRFFHPFAWDGIHLFEFDYDALGRVRYAWEIGGRGGGRLDFEWDGTRLLRVLQHSKADGGDVVYTRTLSYNGTRLVSENIQFGGKTSKIEYKYDKTGVLTEAECSEDLSLDGRSRKVTFLQ